MPLYIKDDSIAQLVAELASKCGVSKQEAVRRAVQAELDRAKQAIPLRERLTRFWQENPLPLPTGEVADKAFFDDLSGNL